jgi:hypothetical protein
MLDAAALDGCVSRGLGAQRLFDFADSYGLGFTTPAGSRNVKPLTGGTI